MQCRLILEYPFFCRIIVYYYKMLKDSNEKKIKLLKDQISLVRVSLIYWMTCPSCIQFTSSFEICSLNESRTFRVNIDINQLNKIHQYQSIQSMNCSQAKLKNRCDKRLMSKLGLIIFIILPFIGWSRQVVPNGKDNSRNWFPCHNGQWCTVI